jgi:acetylornithine deacetylase
MEQKGDKEGEISLSASAWEQLALAALDESALIETLRMLVRQRSLTGREAGAQRWLGEQMHQMGLQVDLWEIDVAQLRQLPAFPGMEVDRSGRAAPGLVGLWQGSEGRRLVFNGHLDVVPAGDPASWSHAPWAADLEEGYIYGRGACDMKGGLIAALYAIKAIKDAGVPLTGTLLVHSVIGEEDGGLGTFATLLRGHRGDAAIVCEPTGLDLVPANAGALTFTVRVPGKSAHACVRRQGVSALEKYLDIHRALVDLERERNSNVTHPLLGQLDLPYALSIGRVQAGNWSSSVPETLVCEGRIGVAVGESCQQVRAQFEHTLQVLAEADPWLKDHPLQITWSGGQFASGEIPPDHPLVQLCGQCVQQVCGRAPTLRGEPYGSDLRLLINDGQMPALLLGPGDAACAHMPDERVAVAEVIQAARIYILIALRYLQGAA